MAEAIGLPPKVLKCKALPKEAAISVKDMNKQTNVLHIQLIFTMITLLQRHPETN